MAYTAIDDSRSVIQHYSYKDTQALNGPADYKILEKIYGKLVDAKVKSRMDRAAQWKARANKVNKMSSLKTKPQI